MTTPIKIAIASIGVSTLAVGGGVGIYKLTRTETKRKINKLITKKGKKIIEDRETDSWSAKWKLFKEAYPENNPPTGNWKIDSWTTVMKNDSDLTIFKNLCKENYEKEVDNENSTLFVEFMKYCVN